MKTRLRFCRGNLLRSAPALAICILLFAVTASAQIVEAVNCSNASQQQYSSINAALAAAVATPGYTPGMQIYIGVSGPCTEAVKISGLQHVNLTGQDSPTVLNQPVVIPKDPSTGYPDYGPALEIDGSSWVLVQNISFTGPGATSGGIAPLVLVQNSSAITVGAAYGGPQVAIQNSVGDGLDVNASQFNINGPATVQNNNEHGISIAGASNVTVGAWNSTQPIAIQGNQDDGVAMGNGGILSVYWYTTISGNGLNSGGTYAGLQMTGSTALLCCGPGPNIDHNTGWGIDAEELSSVVIVGTGGAPASVSHNTQGGIYDVDGWVGIYNTTNIEYNGDSTQANPLGGIEVLSNGALQAYGAIVENNIGPGILVSQSSSADLGLGGTGPTTITGNTGSGIYVQVNGSVQFDGAGTTVTGNSPKDLTCAAAGIAAQDNGTPPTIGKMSCGNFFDLPPRKHKKAKN